MNIVLNKNKLIEHFDNILMSEVQLIQLKKRALSSMQIEIIVFV